MKLNKKLLTLLVSFLVIAVFAVGSTVAFLYTKDGPKTNIFEPSKVTTEVVEVIKNDVKTNVQIKNTGDTDAWIRAYVVITWQDAQGNVYGQMPKIGIGCAQESCNEHHCHISYNEYDKDTKTNAWKRGNDGFWYCMSEVEAGKESPILINTCSSVGNSPDTKYHLNVEIIGSGIQSVPDTVFNNVWGESSGLKVSSNGTTLEAKAGGT